MNPIALNDVSKVAFVSDIHLDSNTPQSRIDDILATTIEKMECILKECISRGIKHVYFEGDVVNRVGITFNAINSFMGVLTKFKEAGISLYSICGNHDIVRNSMEYFDKSPLQTLFSSGLIAHISLETPVVVNGNILITPVDYTEYPPVANKDAKVNILLCHMFINANEYMADAKHNLRTEDIVQLGYDVIVAGHDHAEYPMMNIGNTLVIRHGSLLRGTSHDYNFTRKPNIVVFNDLNNICKDTIEKVVIEHRPYQDIVSNYILNKKQEGTISGLKDMLSNLADRLIASEENDSDRILDIIRTDASLPNDARLKILNYINELS